MFVFITVSYLQNNIIKDYHSKALNRFLALLICENVYVICLSIPYMVLYSADPKRCYMVSYSADPKRA